MAGSVSAAAASGDGGINGDDDKKRKQAPDELQGSKSEPNRRIVKEEHVIAKEENADAIAAIGVFVKKEEDVQEESADATANLVLVQIDLFQNLIDDNMTFEAGAEVLFTEEQVEALGVPMYGDFIVRSSFDNQCYLARFCEIYLNHGNDRARMFQLAGPIWDALEHPIRQKVALRETLSFGKDGDVVVCY